MFKVKNYLRSGFYEAWTMVIQKGQEEEYQYIILGILTILGFPIFYLIWHDFFPQTYENFTLRLIAGFLAIPLILKNYWPKKIRIFLPIYWYFVLIYIIPFFFTFMLLKNNGGLTWQLNGLMALILLLLLTNWIMVIILCLLGISIGTLAYMSSTPHYHWPENVVSTIGSYTPTLIFFAIFLRNRTQVEKEKLQTMKALAANIAHELRTPLAAIQSGISGVNKYFPRILKGYTVAKENNLPVDYISGKNLKILASAFEDISLETNHASIVVEMFLTNIKHSEIKVGGSDIFPISECIQYALSHYPFLPSQKEKIDLDQDSKVDFKVRGDKILIVHILFNLIKNALYFIDKAEKGHISIWLEAQPENNILHFKDTGLGIPKKYLPHIFDRFFSRNTHQGTGVGLAFCKMVMESSGGSITCDSIEGEYTHFQLKFPKLANDSV